MAQNYFVAYFNFLKDEYTRLVVEASFHRLQGDHGLLILYLPHSL
jgi:hypothetical protein